MKRVLTGVAFTVVVVALVHAAMTGKWQGKTKNGLQIVLNLKANKATLTGTITPGDGQPATIVDGKVAKNAFTFTATVDGHTEGFAGELAGDQITLWLAQQGPPSAFVLNRVTAKPKPSKDKDKNVSIPNSHMPNSPN